MVIQAGVTLGIHGWVFSWAGSSSIVAVAIQTSPLSSDASFTAFLAHLLLLCVPFDPKKRPGAEAQSLRSLVTRLIVAGTLCTLLFAPLLHEVAAGNWGPHPVLEVVVDCASLPISVYTQLSCVDSQPTSSCVSRDSFRHVFPHFESTDRCSEIICVSSGSQYVACPCAASTTASLCANALTDTAATPPMHSSRFAIHAQRQM